ncbi:MAG: serine/threonine-protein kinase [Gaiellales bacterium]
MTDDRHESSDPTGPGASASIGHMPRVGSDFASYRIQGVLGRGGMSVVFRADNMRLGNEVALKVLSAELSENDAFRERFVRESRLAASINHPNIIPIYDAGEEDGLLYIAMRYVAGADLKTLIRQEGPLSLRRTADIISQVARGLSVAHQRGLIHRDIKPANILTERAGADGETVDHAYLADFGLMKHQVSRSGLTDTGQFLGTVDYVAPEQVEGRQTDQRSDVYSLGCVLYECLTGSVPYPRDSDVAVLFAHVQDTVPRITDLRPDLTSSIDEIGARAMAKRPEHRYANATDISRDLTEAVGAFRYSHDRPSRAITDPTPREASSYAATPEVVPVPERPAAQEPPAPPPGDSGPGGGGPARPPRGRPSVLVIALGVALAAALAVIAFQLTSGGDSGPSASPGTTASPGGTTAPPTGGTGTTAPTGPVQASDLRQAMPKNLLTQCTNVPPAGQALASLSCSAPSNSAITYDVSMYPDTADVQAVFKTLLASQGIKTNTNGCTKRNWNGERAWTHPTGSLGGHVACYLDANGDSVIMWTHMSQNDKAAPPQPDHRDILGIARQHTQLPGELLTFWKFWSGASGTDSIIGKFSS